MAVLYKLTMQIYKFTLGLLKETGKKLHTAIEKVQCENEEFFSELIYADLLVHW